MNFSREDFLLDLEIHQPNIEKEDLINLIISSSKIPMKLDMIARAI